MPLGQILVELALGLGVALAGANLAVLVRERRRGRAAPPTTYRRGQRGPSTQGHRPSMTRVWMNILVGAAVAAWAAIALAGRG
jgi:hypothetical protein